MVVAFGLWGLIWVVWPLVTVILDRLRPRQ